MFPFNLEANLNLKTKHTFSLTFSKVLVLISTISHLKKVLVSTEAALTETVIETHV